MTIVLDPSNGHHETDNISPVTGLPKRKYTRRVIVQDDTEQLPPPPQTHSALESVSNGASSLIEMTEPYAVRVNLRGVSSLLLHAWNSESIEEKGAAPRGSIIKKTDDLESYVFRDESGYICLPGEYVRQSILESSKKISDPSNLKKRAWELFKAAIISTTELAPILVDGKPCKEWELVDRRRVRVQQAGITRSRPSFYKGWTAELTFINLVPELISFDMLHERLVYAGRLVGVGDFRPSFGRYSVTSFTKEAYIEDQD